eukprot:TRINITY_DN5566_c1_g1_i4.p1 TRINITY_DN5566_c1_g1~~TRINITY_DN5566_c1_g1_i4.p1  ORF type:complete len:247 (-),score=82.72 TRINITY_DN5566_c1_g1_i4:66-806(-)
MMTEDKQLTGWLQKKGDTLKIFDTYKRRWFEQVDTKIFYYENQQSKDPQGHIDLTNFSITRLPKEGNFWPVHINTPQRLYQMLADTEADANYWVKGLTDWKEARTIKPRASRVETDSPSRNSRVEDVGDRRDNRHSLKIFNTQEEATREAKRLELENINLKIELKKQEDKYIALETQSNQSASKSESDQKEMQARYDQLMQDKAKSEIESQQFKLKVEELQHEVNRIQEQSFEKYVCPLLSTKPYQ